MKIQKRNQKNNVANSILPFYEVRIKTIWNGFWSQHISFQFLCIYFFFEYVRPQTIYPFIDVLPWAQIALLLTCISVFLDKSVRRVSNIENKLLILFCLTVIISGIFAFNPSAAWEYRNTMLGWIIVYFLTINIVNTEIKLIVFILAYLLFSFKMSLHGAVTWAQRGFVFADWGLSGAPGWFTNSGEYAIQMLIYGSLAIAFVSSLNNYWGRYKKWFFIFAAATGYIAVVGSSSRGSQLGLLVIGVWMLLRLKGGIKGIAVIFISLIVIFYLLPDEQIQRFQEIGNDPNSLQRLTYWEIGVQIIRENPIIGVGYNNWLSYLSYLYPEGVGVLGKLEKPHNIYIEAASDLGILGLILFLQMIIFAFVINGRTRAISKSLDNTLLYNLSYGLDAGMIGYLVAGSFVSVLYYPFFWVQLSMIVMINSIAKNKLSKL